MTGTAASCHGAQHLGDALVQSGVITVRQLAEAAFKRVSEAYDALKARQ